MARNTSGLKRGGPGRPKGVPNKVTAEVKAACAGLVDDAVYRANLQRRLRKGNVAPAVECLLWYYAKGKPVERREQGGPGDFSMLTDDELKAELRTLLGKL